jgi:5-formyltetrahydrofolate cyclo-ligase
LLASAQFMVKDKIRKSLLEQGLTLSSQSIDKLNTQVQKNIIEALDLSKMNNVLLYFPFKQEIKTNLLHQELAKYSHNIYMPKIFPEKIMKFNLYTREDSLSKNKYGITEVNNEEYLEPHLFDAMFIPFVGVDVNGFRIGYGGGYFDRALASLIGSNHRKPLIIGLGYDYQILSKNLGEPHDLRYHNVVTESRILSYN